MNISTIRITSLDRQNFSGLLSKLQNNKTIPGIDKLYIYPDLPNYQQIEKDVFQKSLPKIEDELTLAINEKSPFEARMKASAVAKEEHKKRKEKYGSEFATPRRKIFSRSEMKAIYSIQYEWDGYNSSVKKMRANEPLNENEIKFCKKVLKYMRPSDKDMVLWRSVWPYDGFFESVNNGKIKLDGFISTNACYDDFFDFWGGPREIEKDGEKYIQKSYFLKIKVPKGTPMLDCNARFFRNYPRLSSEVVLLPSVCKVEDIDVENRVITLVYENSN